MGKPPEVKGYDPKEIFQKIKSENQWEDDLELDPENIPWIYIGNIIQRTLARIIGQGPYGPVTVKCTKEGSLAVVTRGGAFDDYEKLEHVFTAAGQTNEFEFTQQLERIDIFTFSDRIDYQLTRDLIKAYGDKIELFEDSFYSLDFQTRKVKATCVTYSPKATGTTDGTTANHLIDAGINFATDNLCVVGDYAYNVTDSVGTIITAVADGDLTLVDDIFVSGESYAIDIPRIKLVGWFQASD